LDIFRVGFRLMLINPPALAIIDTGKLLSSNFTMHLNHRALNECNMGAWASPLVGQQELYLPAYYQTEFKTIFIGEHTRTPSDSKQANTVPAAQQAD
jgi:hypothetical protein